MFHGLGVAEAEMVDAPACDAGDGGFEPRRSPLSRGTILPDRLSGKSLDSES